MKRISLTVTATLVGLLSLSGAAPAVDRTKRGNNETPITPNQFDPANLPGQRGLDLSGGLNDPFLPSGPFNPFPGQPAGPSNSLVPNPAPETYPSTTPNNQVRVRVQDPTKLYQPPTQDPSQNQTRWRLGVLSSDTVTGVKIHEVIRNSAAFRAGLEPNDVIVAVNGYQVGLVNGTLYELSREFERHADQSGLVTMLVQDQNNRSLVNISVQLDSRFSRIQGSIALSSRRDFPRDANLTVELQEIVRQGAAPLTIARKEIRNFDVNRQSVPFELEYDPAQVSHRGDYVLVAIANSQGRQAFKTIQTFRVNNLGYGDGRPVAMQLEPVKPTYDNVVQIDQDKQIATIVKWFNEYLGRSPSDRELTVWLDALQRGYTLRNVQLELLGHDQFFNRCGRDKENYIVQVHQLLVGRNPSDQEKQYWLGRYEAQNGIRRELAREFQDAVGLR